MTPLGMKPTIFQLEAQCCNKLWHRLLLFYWNNGK